MNIIYIHHRSQHHAKNSGYGRLVDYVDSQVIFGKVKFPFRIAKIFAGFYSQAKGNYNVGSVLKSIELFLTLRKTKGQKNVVHFLNGERDIRHIGFFKRKFPNTRFCATFHKPPEILKKTITDISALRKLDGVIAVGANQVDFLKEWLQLENVVYIPHGVETDFFKPDLSLKQTNTLLFVGQHLRDFKAFNYCIPEIAEKIKELKVNVVVHPAYAKKIEPHPSIKIHSGVNDVQLLNFYNEASLLFLPLIDVTACNSILEALSCGLPIVSSQVGGNSAYLENTKNVLLPKGEFDKYIEAIVELLQQPESALKIGVSSIEKALGYDWVPIGQRVSQFYKTLNNRC